MQASRVQFLVAAALLIALLLVPPGSAYYSTFSDFDDSSWYYNPTYYPNVNCVGISDYGILFGSAPYPAYRDLVAIKCNLGQFNRTTLEPTTYFAFTFWGIIQAGNDYWIYLRDDHYNTIGTNAGLTYFPTGSRVEVKRVGNVWQEYVNGNFYGNLTWVGPGSDWSINPSDIQLQPWSVALNPNGGYFDDVVYGSPGIEDTRSMTGAPPRGWSIRKDLFNPALTGEYDETGTLYDATYYRASYVRPTNSSSPLNIWVNNLQTGVIYEVLPVEPVAGGTNFQAGYTLFNVSAITGSGAPYGWYQVTLPGADHMETFWYISGGATITWGQDIYAPGDTAHITTDISTAYWDTSTYNYYGKTLDLEGNIISTWPITSQVQVHDESMVGYDAGDYFAVLIASPIAGGGDVWMAYDWTTVTNTVNIDGYGIDVYAGTMLPGATVNLSQSSLWYNTTTIADGSYNLTNLLYGLAIGVNASKSGYNFTQFSFTPPAAMTYHLNLTFLPDFIPNNTAIAGVVYEDWSHNPIPGATVYISNDTWTGSSTTASAFGFYMFDNLAAGIRYRLNASAGGYTSSIDYSRSPITGLHIVQNIPLTPAYLLTMTARDATSNALILDTVQFESSDGQITTTTIGMATFHLGFGAYVITASASGYGGDTETVVMTENRNVTLYLTKSATPPQAITYYTQKQVRFKIVDAFGTPLAGANVTANYISTTLPSTDPSWLISAFGISSTVAGEMTNSGLAMAGLTAADGGLVFTMFPSLTYGLTITDTVRGINHYTTIMPQDSDYIIYTALPSQAVQNSSYMPGQLGNTSLFITEPTTSTVQFHMRYYDPSGLTTNLKYNVTCWTNMTPMYYVDLGNPGTAVVTDDTYTVPNVKGQEWRFWLNATRSAAV